MIETKFQKFNQNHISIFEAYNYLARQEGDQVPSAETEWNLGYYTLTDTMIILQRPIC